MSHYGPPGGPYLGLQPGAPARPPKKKGLGAPILVLIVVLALLLCGGGGTALYLIGRSDPDPATRSTAPPSSVATGQASPSSQPTAGTPVPQSSTDARFVKAGQCVKNEGTGTKPKLSITRCEPKTYEVMARFDGATNGEADAKVKCAKVPDYTDWYFYNSELDVLDFVLCLKQR